MRRITFSRNDTLSLSRTCRCYCKYCAFATHRAHLYSPEEVNEHLEQAVRRNARELLVLTGELPEVNPEVGARLEPEWIEQGVLDLVKLKYWSFIPRKRSGRRTEHAIDPEVASRAIELGRRGEVLSEDELTALFAETRPSVIEETRCAADELRAELAGETATFVVNRNINFTSVSSDAPSAALARASARPTPTT